MRQQLGQSSCVEYIGVEDEAARACSAREGDGLLAQGHTHVALVGFRTLERLSDEVICLAELGPPEGPN